MSVPAQFDPAVNSGTRYAADFGPLRCAFEFTGNFYHYAVATIILLILGSCPSAISRRVPLRVIPAIEGVFNWGNPHILQEEFKFLPALTYSNSATAVILEVGNVWIVATREHRQPSAMSLSLGHAVTLKPLAGFFAGQASAGTSYFFGYLVTPNGFNISAVASAYPFISIRQFRGDSDQSSRPHS